nr:MAG TPA: Receptor recognition protein, Long tail, Helical sandwich, Tail fiber [Caudoviricetes sp.]
MKNTIPRYLVICRGWIRLINVSDAFKQKLQNGEKVWQEVEITFPDGTAKTVKDEIMSGNNSFSDCAESSSFPIGCVICKSMTLELDNTSDQWKDYYFYMAKVHAYLKMQIDADTIETIDKGVYTVTTPEQYGEILNLTALDDMYKTNAVHSTKLVLPQTVESLVRDACSTLGITAGFSKMAHGNLIVNELPKDMTYRQLFGWAAMLDTANARLDSNGSLQFVRWNLDAVPNIELKDYISMPTVSSDDIVITGINIISGDNSETYGTSGYILSMENNLVGESDLATVAAQIGDSIIGAKFRNLQGDMAFNPLLEFGDVAYTYDRNLNQYVTPLTDVSYTINGKTTLKTQADDPIRGMSLYYSGVTKAIVAARRLVEKEKNARELAIEKLQESLSVGSGLFATYVQQEDGSTISYFHDKGTLEESKNVIKITSEAIGVSNDGGKTYPFGFQLTGTMIAKLLYAEGINADFINAGALTIKDGQGNIIFSVNVDTNSVYINPEYLMIGDVSLSDKIKELDENVAAAKNMTMTLSNEYQAISTDENGNIPGEFPQVQTTAQVMYGTMDVTDDCSYTITESENVTGIWDKSTHTYTVSEVTADNVWVDIKAVYLNALTITRRFNVSKQKSGTPGRTYVLESSTTILKKESENSITPNVVIFSAYYRDGKNTGRTDYAGRFVIEETSDGKTWKTAYSSVADETSVNYYVDYIFADSDGVLIADSDGSLIGARSKDIVGLRCSLYASGGTTNLIDTVKLDVITEVTALTQEDILKLLTNDGEWKGVYRGADGKLYISFSAAMGGLLKLGGKNNGNGVLKVFDESGRLINILENRGFMYGYDLNDKNLEFTQVNQNGCQLYIWDKENKEIIRQLDVGINWRKSSDGNKYVVEINADKEFTIILNDGIDSDTNPYSPFSCDYNYSTIYNKFRCYKGEVTLDSLTSKATKLLNVKQNTNAYNLLIMTDGTVTRAASSSKRYKDIGDAISEMDIDNWYKIEPVWAKYKDGYLAEGDENEERYLPMFIAEDVEEHFPQAATHMNGQIEDWNYRMMIPAMFAMIKQQKSEIDNLKEDIKELRKNIKEMRGE